MKSAKEWRESIDALTIGRLFDDTQGRTHDYYRHRDFEVVIAKAQRDACEAMRDAAVRECRLLAEKRIGYSRNTATELGDRIANIDIDALLQGEEAQK